MRKKIQLAIICGGQSAEHEVSLVSAKHVVIALDKNKYDIHVIVIQKNGDWMLLKDINQLMAETIEGELMGAPVALNLGQTKNAFLVLEETVKPLAVDVVFPVLHGSHGEDGTMQGLLELANLPYVGPAVLSSAVCMDKAVSKALLQAANIPTADYLVFNHDQINQIDYAQVLAKLGLPFFVKPANTGSSVGISKVKSPEEFQAAIALALRYDCKILIEKFIAGREIECAVLGNENPQASLPGEIISHHEFYTYEAKYIDPNGASLVIPADLPVATVAKLQEIAKRAYSVLGCEGMTRMDFFITSEQEIYVNEANTIPGFTPISMYPKLWQATGLAYNDLLDQLIVLAIQRFQRNRVLVENRNTTETLNNN